MPTIFVNPNGLCFLLRNRGTWESPKIVHLPRTEALRYAATFQLHELKAYLAQVRASAPVP